MKVHVPTCPVSIQQAVYGPYFAFFFLTLDYVKLKIICTTKIIILAHTPRPVSSIVYLSLNAHLTELSKCKLRYVKKICCNAIRKTICFWAFHCVFSSYCSE